jgi:hypothetical protein
MPDSTHYNKLNSFKKVQTTKSYKYRCAPSLHRIRPYTPQRVHPILHRGLVVGLAVRYLARAFQNSADLQVLSTYVLAQAFDRSYAAGVAHDDGDVVEELYYFLIMMTSSQYDDVVKMTLTTLKVHTTTLTSSTRHYDYQCHTNPTLTSPTQTPPTPHTHPKSTLTSPLTPQIHTPKSTYRPTVPPDSTIE